MERRQAPHVEEGDEGEEAEEESVVSVKVTIGASWKDSRRKSAVHVCIARRYRIVTVHEYVVKPHTHRVVGLKSVTDNQSSNLTHCPPSYHLTVPLLDRGITLAGRASRRCATVIGDSQLRDRDTSTQVAPLDIAFLL